LDCIIGTPAFQLQINLINFLLGCTVGVRALALIPTCNAMPWWIQRSYCDVYTQDVNFLTYIR